MDRVFESGASATPPSAPASPSTGYPAAGNPGSGTPATKPGPWWYYMVTEALRKFVTDAGLTPDHTNVNQLKAAMDALYSSAGTVQGAFKNLALSATGTNANVSVTADELVLEDASNKYVTARTVSLTISAAASGANGLDTGTSAASTWYSVWVIRKADGTTAGLLSTSATAPTMPSGYTFKARVGWIRTDATGNKYPLSFIQKGCAVQYKVAAGSNVTGLPIAASGAVGNISTPTWVAVATGNFVPSTAAEIRISANTAGPGATIVAPNNAYGAEGSTTNPPPVVSSSGSGGSNSNAPATLVLESTNIYWAANSATGVLAVIGWTDSL